MKTKTRGLVEKKSMKKNNEFGYASMLDVDSDWSVRKIVLGTNEKSATQCIHANKTLIVVEGSVFVKLDYGGVVELQVDDRFYIKTAMLHRIYAGPLGCTMIEVQINQGGL